MNNNRQTSGQKFRSFLFFLVKIGVSFGILGFLVWRAMQNEKTLDGLLHGEKIWSSLALGFLFTFLAVFTTIVRWYQLVRIEKMNVGFWSTVRIGYIGYLFNLAPMGIVGGDLLKAWLLTRREKEKYPNAGPIILGSMFVDRMIGLYALFMLASLVMLAMGILQKPELSPTLRSAAWAVMLAWGIGTIGWLALLLPPESKKKVRPPRSKAEEFFQKIASSVRLYRNYPFQLLGILLASLLVHTLFATSLYFLADGLWRSSESAIPTYLQHLYISPTSMSTSAIPLPVGPLEAVFDELYRDEIGDEGVGLVVMLAYRLSCLAIALLGVFFYFSARDETRAALEDANSNSVS